MTARLLVSTLLVFSGTAFAATETGSEFQHQTPADQMELTPALGYNSMSVKLKPSGSGDVKGMHERVKFEYGISEMFSAGVMLENASEDSTFGTTKTTQSGLRDLRAFLQGRNEMSSASLRYGAFVDFGLAKSKTEANGDSNNSSGGIALEPFVGYEMYMAPCTYGVRLAYHLFVGDRSETVEPSTENKLEGPSTLTTSLFFEHEMNPMKLGAALQIINESTTKTKTNGGTSVDAHTPHSAYNIKLYVPYMVTPTITVLPEFNYSAYTAIPSGYDSVNSWTLDVGARFVF